MDAPGRGHIKVRFHQLPLSRVQFLASRVRDEALAETGSGVFPSPNSVSVGGG